MAIISQDIELFEDRASPTANKNSNVLKILKISNNHLLRVEDLGKTWKISLDITMYKMPAFDRQWFNIFHLTRNGKSNRDNIFKFSVHRNGMIGKFFFQYWKQSKEMLFTLGSSYHIVIEQFKAQRSNKYEFDITVDGENLVHENLKDIEKGLPKAYKKAKLFASNPWERTLPPNVGRIKNFVIPTGEHTQCCSEVAVEISSHVKLQKDKIGIHISYLF